MSRLQFIRLLKNLNTADAKLLLMRETSEELMYLLPFAERESFQVERIIKDLLKINKFIEVGD